MAKFQLNSLALIGLVLAATISLVFGQCTYDVQCGTGGRCENGVCHGAPIGLVPGIAPSYPGVGVGQIQPVLAAGTCVRNVDCLQYGIYMQCKKGRCEKSDHKICLTDNDCAKNWVNKRCINNGCTLFVG